jgi:hypothetical protein
MTFGGVRRILLKWAGKSKDKGNEGDEGDEGDEEDTAPLSAPAPLKKL